MISHGLRAALEGRVAELMAQAMTPDDRVALARASEAQGIRWVLDLSTETAPSGQWDEITAEVVARPTRRPAPVRRVRQVTA